MFESEADRLALIKGAGGEQFDAGASSLLWGIFDRESLDALAGQLMPLRNRRPVLKCRESDATAMKVTKGSRLRRLSDDSVYVVRDLAPDGTGMIEVTLGA